MHWDLKRASNSLGPKLQVCARCLTNGIGCWDLNSGGSNPRDCVASAHNCWTISSKDVSSFQRLPMQLTWHQDISHSQLTHILDMLVWCTCVNGCVHIHAEARGDAGIFLSCSLHYCCSQCVWDRLFPWTWNSSIQVDQLQFILSLPRSWCWGHRQALPPLALSVW